MPNWCDNSFTVEGPAEKLALFVSTFKGENNDSDKVGLFGSFLPVPEPLVEATKGSESLAYDLYYGEIPHYVYMWDEVKDADITEETDNVRERLIELLAQSHTYVTREVADLYKYNKDTYGFLCWYDWCVANWGTKWDVPKDEYLGAANYEDQAVHTYFNTAWGPALEWAEQVSLDWPELEFTTEYSEFGMWFAGRHRVKNGEVLVRVEGEPQSLGSNGEPMFPFCYDEAVEAIRENGECGWESGV